jgi:hypothetical protein
VPELGIDPLKPPGINFLMSEQVTEGAKSESAAKALKELTGSLIMLDIARERRELIEKKHDKRMQEEHFLKI